MTPRNEAIAFRIWQHGTGCDWLCQPEDIADALDMAMSEVYRVLRKKPHWRAEMVLASTFAEPDDTFSPVADRQAIARMVGGDV